MPAKDGFHDVVKRALVKDGWTIVRDQYPIRVDQKRVWIDLSIRKEEDSAILLVEVKDFANVNSVEQLRDAMGQYLLYRAAIRYARLIDAALYLAVPNLAMRGILGTALGKFVIEEASANLLIFDPVEEKIEQWLPYKKPSEP